VDSIYNKVPVTYFGYNFKNIKLYALQKILSCIFKKTVSKFLGKISTLCSCCLNTTIRLTEVARICFTDFKTWKSKEHSITNEFQQTEKSYQHNACTHTRIRTRACVCVCVCVCVNHQAFLHMGDYKHNGKDKTQTHTPRGMYCNAKTSSVQL